MRQRMPIDPLSGKVALPYDSSGEELQALIGYKNDFLYSFAIDLSTAQSFFNPLVINVPGRAVVLYGISGMPSVYDPVANSGTESVNLSAFVFAQVQDGAAKIPLVHNRGLRGSFTKLSLSWPAQPGVSARIVVQKCKWVPWYNGEAYNTPFFPNQLGGLVFWLDGSDPSTMTPDGAGNIKNWMDKGPNRLNFTTTANGAAYKYSTTAIQANGPGMLSGNSGAGEQLKNGQTTIFPYVAGPATFFCVYNATAFSDSDAFGSYLFDFIDDSASNDYGVLSLATASHFPTLRSANIGTNPKLQMQPGGAMTGPHYLMFQYTGGGVTNSANWNGRFQGSAQAVLNIAGTDQDAQFNALQGNSGRFVSGALGMVLIYNRALSASEITLVETYIKKTFGF